MNNDDWKNRTELILGKDAVQKLAKSHVLVMGAGGVGGIALEMLVRAGVGSITVADGDRVDPTNRNRQITALCSTVGEYKTEVFRRRLLDINPDLDLTILTQYFTAEDMTQLIQPGSFDCVLDAIDTVAPKTALLIACVQNGIPVVSSMGSGAKLDPEAVRTLDISKTAVCPLARAVRTNLRKAGIHRGVTAVFSTEPSAAHAVMEVSEQNKRSTTGTISYMPAVFGCHCASAVIRHLING
ncbi:MAG: tRNA threonylcarbamoyladenosine dehydratase [Lentisphaeria bacterium]|nr:tRNA threonylcarbamoyladenosine dehydratase [Lentisphaeria bacterium]